MTDLYKNTLDFFLVGFDTSGTIAFKDVYDEVARILFKTHSIEIIIVVGSLSRSVQYMNGYFSPFLPLFRVYELNFHFYSPNHSQLKVST